MHTAFQAAEAQFQTAGPSLVERVAKCVTDFNAQLSSAHAGALSQVRHLWACWGGRAVCEFAPTCLAQGERQLVDGVQVWLPEVGEDGSIQLNTQASQHRRGFVAVHRV